MANFKQADWAVVRDAEKNGLVVSMCDFIVEPKRTELNNRLYKYFLSKTPKNFKTMFNEYEGEDILYCINEYIEENEIEKYQLDFPTTEGTDIHLVPITENLSVKVTAADEYYGGGSYEKYVAIDRFIITEDADESDVDKLIEFVEYLRW